MANLRDRRSVVGALRQASRYPQRAKWYLHRLRRDARLRLSHRDHLAYYGAVVDDLVVTGKATAVGDDLTARSRRVGKLQFDYLRQHGLEPHHRLLEIGCGNLRAGWRLIRYLEPGHYYGVDISQQVLFAAQQTVARRGLTDKLPYLLLVRDQTFTVLPDASFDVIHAHSVFSHAPLDVIEDCFAHVGRLMKPDGFFDFTFKRTEGKEYGKLREDFYFRKETLIDAADRHGLSAQFMDDWEALGHSQSKIRITLPQEKSKT
ncbi:MAG TPA: class I SAM-dependent methyltransferase [Mycobacteriales bacterium]|nr:class I SAM-dependent methyltransferase [Mycobacteriales bacterium]